MFRTVWRQLSSRTRMVLIESCFQTCMTYTISEWINSWRWAEQPPETCRVSCRSKFGKLVHLVGFIIKKFVTMHGHVNVKIVGIQPRHEWCHQHKNLHINPTRILCNWKPKWHCKVTHTPKKNIDWTTVPCLYLASPPQLRICRRNLWKIL